MTATLEELARKYSGGIAAHMLSVRDAERKRFFPELIGVRLAGAVEESHDGKKERAEQTSRDVEVL